MISDAGDDTDAVDDKAAAAGPESGDKAEPGATDPEKEPMISALEDMINGALERNLEEVEVVDHMDQL